MTGTKISEVGTVFVPVSDQERALAFYVGTLGFEKRADFRYGDDAHRWIEVAPPGASNTISLVPSSEGRSAGGDETYCAFATADIESDHATLRAAGVAADDVAGAGSSRSGLISSAITVDNPVPSQFFIRDPDGNRFLIVQPG